MAYGLADAQLALRATRCGTLVVMAGHFPKIPIDRITRECG
jgi:hypothetical protein